MRLIDDKQLLLNATPENFDLFARIYDFRDTHMVAPLNQISKLASSVGVLKDFANEVMQPFFDVEAFDEHFIRRTIKFPVLATIDSDAIINRMYPITGQNTAKITYTEISKLRDSVKFQSQLIPIISALNQSSSLMVNFQVDTIDDYQFAAFTYARHIMRTINPNKLIHPLEQFDSKDYEYYNLILTDNPDLTDAQQKEIVERFYGDDQATMVVTGEDEDMMSLTFILQDHNNTIVDGNFDFMYKDDMIKADFTTIGRYLAPSTNQSNIETFNYYMEIIFNQLVASTVENVLLIGDTVTWGADSMEVQMATINVFDMEHRYEYIQAVGKDLLAKAIFSTAPEKTLIRTANAGVAHMEPFKNQKLDDVRIKLRESMFSKGTAFYRDLRANLDEVGMEDSIDE